MLTTRFHVTKVKVFTQVVAATTTAWDFKGADLALGIGGFEASHEKRLKV